MWTRRYPRVAHKTHHLTLAYSNPLLDPSTKRIQMRIKRRIPIRMFDNQKIAIPAFPVRKRHRPVPKRHYRSARRTRPVHTIMWTHTLQYRMHPLQIVRTRQWTTHYRRLQKGPLQCATFVIVIPFVILFRRIKIIRLKTSARHRLIRRSPHPPVFVKLTVQIDLLHKHREFIPTLSARRKIHIILKKLHKMRRQLARFTKIHKRLVQRIRHHTRQAFLDNLTKYRHLLPHKNIPFPNRHADILGRRLIHKLQYPPIHVQMNLIPIPRTRFLKIHHTLKRRQNLLNIIDVKTVILERNKQRLVARHTTTYQK